MMQGLDELMITLEGLGINSLVVAEKGMKKAIKKIQANAKTLAPVDTERLRNSIKTRVNSMNKELIGQVYSAAEYAKYVEFGTGTKGMESNENEIVNPSYSIDIKGNVAQPFLYPALLHAKNTGTALKTISDEMQKEIKNFKG